MPIEVSCPGCEKEFAVPDHLAGKTIRCKGCGESVEVPEAKKAAPAKPAKPASKPVVAVDDDEDDAPRPSKTAKRKVDDEDDDDESPRVNKGKGKPAEKKSSMLPLLLIGGFGLLIVLGGVTAGGLYFAGVFGGGGQASTTPTQPLSNNVPPPGPSGNDGPENAGPGPVTTPTTSAPAPSPATKPSTPPTTPATRKAEPPVNNPPPSIKPKINQPSTPSPVTGSQKNTLDPATRERLKKATVYFECVGSNGTGRWSGSGWFGLEENLIWTNAHVMGMDTPGGRPPSKITVYINPGTTQQREIPHARLELLAVDRKRDLALLRVNGEKDLPTPMQIRFSSELNELDNLVVMGYPGGRKLSMITGNTNQPAVTVNQSSVGSVRRDNFGNISAVQINGGTSQGGSGGPIVDMDGNVVAVTFMGPADTLLATAATFGVPTEYVQGLFAGRVDEVEYGQPYRSSGMIRMPVTVKALDPFNRIKDIGIGFWVADANTKTRPPGQTRTQMDPSDANYREVKLTYKHSKEKQIATGELEFPELQAGRVFMAQPFYSNQILEKYYMAGNTIKLVGPPVDREPADLIARLKANAGLKRLVTMSNASALEEFEEGEGADKKERVLRKTELKAYETVLQPQDQAAIATLRLQFDTLNLTQELPGLGIKIELPPSIRKLLNDNLKMVQGFAHVGKDGQIYKTYTDIRAAQGLGPLYQGLTNGAIVGLMHSSVPLPNKRMNPLETWTQARDESLFLTYVSDLDDEPQAGPPGGAGGQPAPRPGAKKKTARTKELKYRVDATYTYLGTRVRAGQKEAVVRVEAKIIPAAGGRAGSAAGSIEGYASIDIDTGIVLEAEIEREYELDTSESGIKKRVSGLDTSKLTRGTGIRN